MTCTQNQISNIFPSFYNSETMQVVESPLHRKQGTVYPALSIPWLLMAWWQNVIVTIVPLPVFEPFEQIMNEIIDLKGIWAIIAYTSKWYAITKQDL